VQDPRHAAFAEMPQAALELAKPDHVADLEHLPALLYRLVKQSAGDPQAAPAPLRFEVEIASGQRRGAAMSEMDAIGRRSALSCPDCHGVLWEIDEGELRRFRCHVGHTYSADMLNLSLDEGLRRALASGQRALEERVALARSLHSQAEQTGRRHMTSHWAARVREYEQELAVIRDAMRRFDEIAAQEEQR
jgi:two-component system chemotaxis response regulator CheB